MLTRRELVATVVSERAPTERIVVGLGFLSRELYASTGGDQQGAFYCLGSMGSVIPLTLGLHLGRPDLRFLALEGDGSLLSNLACLVTLSRYGDSRVTVVVCDNRCYESTGGQPSQPESLRIGDFARAAGMILHNVADSDELRDALATRPRHAVAPAVIVASTALGAPQARIDADPAEMARQFQGGLPVDTPTLPGSAREVNPWQLAR